MLQVAAAAAADDELHDLPGQQVGPQLETLAESWDGWDDLQSSKREVLEYWWTTVE